ncbi:MAG: DegT/DnrJ/EryC1/StrS family aminotransferase [Calditrichaeota bacterium]|nr:MAG: DegT/DnrJ/EryC1/StrS family aminotransferase [Calditrichota bacterium]
MTIPQADLRKQYETIKEEIDDAISRVVDQTRFVRGPFCAEFEQAFARFCETGYAVGVANGTDALMLALRAVGVGPGDEVITVPFTFTATAEAIHWVGAKIVFVDICAENYTMDVAQVEARITERTRAILPVHLYGHPADLDPLLALAKKYDLKIIEDAAQAHGARYKGRRVGSLGHAGCFSFYPGKNLGAYGDAGGVTTDDARVAENVRKLGDHGSSKKYVNDMLGFNSRLDGLQAAVLQVKLGHLEAWNARRREITAYYNEALADIEDIEPPGESDWAESVYHLYVIQVPDRDAVRQKLNDAGIGAAVHYPRPLHLQPAYAFLGLGEGSFPVAERAAERVLSLPNFPEMTEAQLAYVVEHVRAIFGKR